MHEAHWPVEPRGIIEEARASCSQLVDGFWMMIFSVATVQKCLLLCEFAFFSLKNFALFVRLTCVCVCVRFLVSAGSVVVLGPQTKHTNSLAQQS